MWAISTPSLHIPVPGSADESCALKANQQPVALLAWIDQHRRQLFLCLAALYLLGFNGQWQIEPDSALYLTLARNLARGLGYTYHGAPQNLAFPGSLAATISDETSVMLLAKYTSGPVKVYGGYEHIFFAPPSNPQTTFSNIGGYTVFTPDISNTTYNANNRILQVFWTGARYAFTANLDAGIAYYHYLQNDWGGPVSCATAGSSSSHCSGTMDAASFDIDWKFAKKFDVYAGLMFSEMNNGLANGFLNHTNIDPTVGLRFRF